MGTELAPQQKFEERVKEKLRDDIGNLIDDEVLEAMMQRSFDELFFQRKVVRDQWGNTQSDEPSWFNQEVQKLVGEEVKTKITEWLDNNREFVAQQVAVAITECLPQMLVSSILQNLTQANAAAAYTLTSDAINQLKSDFNMS